MSRRADNIPAGAWPALLTQERAAAYCDMSVNTFKARVPVAPVKIGESVRYYRAALDAYFESLMQSPVSGSPSEAAGNGSGARHGH